MAYKRYVYSKINWKNKSEALTTPLGKTNLNHADEGIYNIAENLDVAYNELSAGKFDEAKAGKVIVGMPTWNPDTGVLTFKFYDGTQFSVDFNVEKIPVSFSMDSAGVITMTTADGTKWTADIGNIIPDCTFEDSDTIAFHIGYKWDTSSFPQIDKEGYGPPEGEWNVQENRNKVYLDKTSGIAYVCAYDGKKYFLIEKQLEKEGKDKSVSAVIKKNSITDEYMQPNYLADITTQTANAVASAELAADYAADAAYDAKLAQSYSVGGSGVRAGEDKDNAKASKEAAQQAAEAAQEALANMQNAQVTGVKGNAESAYRKGNVNLTPANIGAVNKTGDSLSGTFNLNGNFLPSANNSSTLGSSSNQWGYIYAKYITSATGSSTGNAFYCYYGSFASYIRPNGLLTSITNRATNYTADTIDTSSGTTNKSATTENIIDSANSYNTNGTVTYWNTNGSLSISSTSYTRVPTFNIVRFGDGTSFIRKITNELVAITVDGEYILHIQCTLTSTGNTSKTKRFAVYINESISGDPLILCVTPLHTFELTMVRKLYVNDTVSVYMQDESGTCTIWHPEITITKIK